MRQADFVQIPPGDGQRRREQVGHDYMCSVPLSLALGDPAAPGRHRRPPGLQQLLDLADLITDALGPHAPCPGWLKTQVADAVSDEVERWRVETWSRLMLPRPHWAEALAQSSS